MKKRDNKSGCQADDPLNNVDFDEADENGMKFKWDTMAFLEPHMVVNASTSNLVSK
jgi:hypothetical protein